MISLKLICSLRRNSFVSESSLVQNIGCHIPSSDLSALNDKQSLFPVGLCHHHKVDLPQQPVEERQQRQGASIRTLLLTQSLVSIILHRFKLSRIVKSGNPGPVVVINSTFLIVLKACLAVSIRVAKYTETIPQVVVVAVCLQACRGF